MVSASIATPRLGCDLGQCVDDCGMRPIAVRSIGRAQVDTDWDYARGAGAGQHHQRTDRRNQRAVGGAQALDRRHRVRSMFHVAAAVPSRRRDMGTGPCRRRRPTPPEALRLMAVTALSASPCCSATGVGRDPLMPAAHACSPQPQSWSQAVPDGESAGSAGPAPRQPPPVRRGAASDRAQPANPRSRLPSQTPLPGRGVPLLEEDASAPRARAPLQPGL